MAPAELEAPEVQPVVVQEELGVSEEPVVLIDPVPVDPSCLVAP